MDALVVILEEPERLKIGRLPLTPATPDDVVVDIEWSGISTGTERLLFTGRMPPFPGMGYPLVPGYESVGRITQADAAGTTRVGQRVFVPGARCFGDVHALFGGTASRLVVPAGRVIPIDESLEESGVLLALAATAFHAIDAGTTPDLIVGHGVLGRLLARLAVAQGGEPIVWENNPLRADGGAGYQVLSAERDERRDYRAIYDVSGDATLLDTLIGRLGRGGEITLAGFYSEPISFRFPPAFMKEAKIRVAAEWLPGDLVKVNRLVSEGQLALNDLITHRHQVGQDESPTEAYRTAFNDPTCLKMLLEWRSES